MDFVQMEKEKMILKIESNTYLIAIGDIERQLGYISLQCKEGVRLREIKLTVLRAGDIAQLVELLPHKHKALGSVPSTAKKKKNNNCSQIKTCIRICNAI